MHKQGNPAETHNAAFIKRPESTRITSLSELCSVCHKIHDDRIPWIAILERASGRLTDSDLAKYITHSLEFSHLCRNAWCVNAAQLRTTLPTSVASSASPHGQDGQCSQLRCCTTGRQR
jgi:hypothetical protein